MRRDDARGAGGPASDEPAALRTPPHSVEAEQSVLGALMTDATRFPAVADVLAPADFFTRSHRLIFDAIAQLIGAGQPVDVVTVFEQLEGEATDFGGLKYLNDLAQGVPSATNVVSHAGIVSRMSILRAAVAAADEVAALAFSSRDADATLERALAAFDGINRKRIEKTPGADAKGSPLANYAPLDLGSPKAPEFIVDNVLVAGVVVLAGGEGQGKTVQLVSLLTKAGWLCRPDDPLRPLLRRRVVYITEDVPQVRLILVSILRFGDTGCTEADFDEWFKVVPATRGPSGLFVEVLPEYVKLRTPNRMANGGVLDVDPVVVLDTKSAVLAVDDENDNAQISKDIALLKQQFGLPVIIVGHLAKALNKSDVSAMSMRGAGAAQGDAHQTMFLYHDKDADKRYLHVGPPAKRRFESPIEALEFTSVAHQIDATDPLGNPVKLWVRHSTVEPVTGDTLRESRTAAVEDRRAEEQRARDVELRGALLDVADAAWRDGMPLSSRALANRVLGFKSDDKRDIVAQLLAESWLFEASVPSRWRLVNNARRTWIVRLSAGERDAFRATGALPDAARRPPPSIAVPPEGASE